MADCIKHTMASLAQFGRLYYEASGEAMWALVIIGVATGHVYLRTDDNRVAAGVDLHDIGWVMETVVLTLVACNLWRHSRLVCALAGVGTACAFFVLIALGARLSSGDWRVVRVD
jgi:hypothetical protein